MIRPYGILPYGATYRLSVSEGRKPCYEMTGCGPDYRTGGLNCDSVTLAAPSPYECEGYRLPTSAEWEYAARAGTRTPFYSGEITVYTPDQLHDDLCQPDANLDRIAWYCYNSGDRPRAGGACTTEGCPRDNRVHVAGQLEPNAWGLHDVLGNMMEWMHDRGRLPTPDPSTDPAVPGLMERDHAFELRGCGFTTWPEICRVADRPSTSGWAQAGFRLVRTLLPGAGDTDAAP